MKCCRLCCLVIVICGLCSANVLGREVELLTVSPGGSASITGVETHCPTFSWQGNAGFERYLLVVYELPPETDLTSWTLDEAREVLFVELPAGATAWTPPLENALTRGADHVWFVRGLVDADDVQDREVTQWSSPRFFRVEAGFVENRAHSHLWDGGGSPDANSDSVVGAERSRESRTEPGRSARAQSKGELRTKDAGTAAAAIRGEMPDATGETYGIVGTSNSPEGAGLGAVNTAGGPDLVLDGVEDGETDLLVSQSGVERASPAIERFNFTNPDVGDLDVHVQGWVFSQDFVGGGANLANVDAETLDGVDSSGFSPSAHLHDDRYYTETELATSGGGGAVHWNNLTALPVGLDDGDDDTTYAAGTGLELAGTVFNAKGTGFANVIIVATDGGDLTSIQAAIDAITDAAADNPYLVWVAPGVYTEEVTLTPHVHLQGAGQEVTIITSSAGSFFPVEATLVMADDSSVRDITLESNGAGDYHVALGAPIGTGVAVASRVTARSLGAGNSNYAVFLKGEGTDVVLDSVNANAENASSENFALYIYDSPSATVNGGFFTALGGSVATGIALNVDSPFLYGRDITASARLGTTTTVGLSFAEATVVLDGGSFTAQQGGRTVGIGTTGVSTLVATGVVATGSSGVGENRAFYGTGDGDITLRGGHFFAFGGTEAIGIALNNTSMTLEADGVTAMAQGGSNSSEGISVRVGAAVLRGGLFSGLGGDVARGAYVEQSTAILQVTGATLRGAQGSVNSKSIRQIDGTVNLGVTLIDGFISKSGGTLTCFQVFDDSFSAYTCP